MAHSNCSKNTVKKLSENVCVTLIYGEKSSKRKINTRNNE